MKENFRDSPQNDTIDCTSLNEKFLNFKDKINLDFEPLFESLKYDTFQLILCLKKKINYYANEVRVLKQKQDKKPLEFHTARSKFIETQTLNTHESSDKEKDHG